MFNPDQSQQWVLLTWYPIDSPLHLDARHPAIGLAGEAGELLNLYKKFEYKPGYDFDRGKFILELSDYSYYLRILAYIKGVTFEALCTYYNVNDYVSENLLDALAHLNDKSAWILTQYVANQSVNINDLQIATLVFLAILHKLDCSLPHLLELNYHKLNSEESHHGWRDATIKSRA